MAQDVPNVPTKKTIPDLTGSWGLTQKYIFACMLYATAMLSWQSLAVTFLAPTVDHWCDTGVQSVEDEKLPKSDTTQDSCVRWVNSTSQACTKWNYSHHEFSSTLTEKYQLVCDKKWIVSLMKSVFMFGSMIMNPIVGTISDRFGRRTAALVSAVPGVIGCSLILASQNVYMAIIGQTLNGVSSGCALGPVVVLLMELTDGKRRFKLALMMEVGFASGSVLLCLVSWQLRDWFYIQLVGLVLAAVLLIMNWFLVESPTWLITKGQKEKAFEAVQRIALRNRKDVTSLRSDFEDIYQVTESSRRSPSSGNAFKKILKTWKGLRQTILIMYTRFVVGMVYYGIAMNVRFFGEHLFTDFLLSASLAIPSMVIVFIVLGRVSPRNTMIACLVVESVVCLIYSVVTGLEIRAAGLHTSLVVLGWMSCAPVMPLAILMTGEIYPTAVRGTVTGVGLLVARAGAAFAAYCKELGESLTTYTPMVIFGIGSVGAVISILLLPDFTSNTVMQSVEEFLERNPSKKPEKDSQTKTTTSL